MTLTRLPCKMFCQTFQRSNIYAEAITSMTCTHVCPITTYKPISLKHATTSSFKVGVSAFQGKGEIVQVSTCSIEHAFKVQISFSWSAFTYWSLRSQLRKKCLPSSEVRVALFLRAPSFNFPKMDLLCGFRMGEVWWILEMGLITGGLQTTAGGYKKVVRAHNMKLLGLTRPCGVARGLGEEAYKRS